MGLPILLKNPKILLIGAGNVALQKAQVLSENRVEFYTVSRDFTPEIFAFSKHNKNKNFELCDINGFDYIIDATGNKTVTEMLLEAKKERFFILNVVDVPHLCDFYFQALLNYGKLQISVSSNGASPIAAQVVRDKIKSFIPAKIEPLLEDIAQKREQGIIEKEKIKASILETFENNNSAKKSPKAYIVGCGTGDVELLTIRAYKIIQSIDVALVDNLISNEIQAIIPNSCKVIDVGKKKGFHRKSQDEINSLIYHYVCQGKSVARLKSGDPYLYGRGAEEALFLIKQGFENIEVVPGVTSALSGCTTAGIPVTHRDMAKSFSVVTAHLKGNSLNLDWIDLLKRESHTTVVLMGLSRVESIVEKAIEIGCDENLSCAVVSNASRPNQTVLISKLKDLVQNAQEIKKSHHPSIIVFGDVVELGNILPTYNADIKSANINRSNQNIIDQIKNNNHLAVS